MSTEDGLPGAALVGIGSQDDAPPIDLHLEVG